MYQYTDEQYDYMLWDDEWLAYCMCMLIPYSIYKSAATYPVHQNVYESMYDRIINSYKE